MIGIRVRVWVLVADWGELSVDVVPQLGAVVQHLLALVVRVAGLKPWQWYVSVEYEYTKNNNDDDKNNNNNYNDKDNKIVVKKGDWD